MSVSTLERGLSPTAEAGEAKDVSSLPKGRRSIEEEFVWRILEVGSAGMALYMTKNVIDALTYPGPLEIRVASFVSSSYCL